MNKECTACDQIDCPFIVTPVPAAKVTVKTWTEYGELTIDIGKKEYTYFGVSRTQYKKINVMLTKGFHGKVIQYLNCHHSQRERVCTKKTS